MKQRLLTALLALLMLLAAIPTVQAADFTDIDDHWGKSYIEKAVELGLFSGVSETRFNPNGTMTRGMFVTVLGRLEGIDTAYWSDEAKPAFFVDVDPKMYYAPYICWAVCNGVADGTSHNTFSPEKPVTREQAAKLIAYYVQKLGHGLKPAADSSTIPDSFADAAEISSWAADSVDILRVLGILNGMPDETGAICFKPQNKLTRAECAAIFCRLNESLIFSTESDALTPHTGIALNHSTQTMKLGETLQLTATLLPSSAAPVEPVWWTSDAKVATVEQGVVTVVGYGSATITVCTPLGFSAKCVIHCISQDLASADETYEEKCIRVFGEVVDNPKYYYAIYDENGNYVGIDYEAAAADMVEITVPAWDLRSNGEKYTRYFTTKVHKNLAATYEQIFKEIYEGEEKFPLYYVWSYSQSGRSEHTIGTAVDLNPNENYYYNSRTGEQVGDYWKPGEDPYSIPLDGEVATIFAKYGFSQGIWTYTVDYMHFSYFGT